MNSFRALSKLIRREQYMLNQFCTNLQVMITRLADKDETASESLFALEKHLDDDPSWASANRVELALVDFYDDATLVTEWQRRLAEIDYLPAHLVKFYKQHITEMDTVKIHTLLVRLVTDLQWSRESRRVIRFNEGKMRSRTVALFLCGFVLFFLPTLLRITFNFEFDNLRIYYIFTAATAGILGAAFSQLTSIQSRVQAATLDQVRAMSLPGYIVARAMVGAGAGLIMFYLLQSGLLSGAFFPEFIHTAAELEGFQVELTGGVADTVQAVAPAFADVSDGVQAVSQKVESTLSVGTLARPAQGLSLLIVWCLIAGFSEKLIPGILNKKAEEAEEAAAKEK